MDKNSLYVLQSDSTIKAMEFTIVGEKNDSMLVSGLKNKQKVLFEAYSNFNNGQKVRPIE